MLMRTDMEDMADGIQRWAFKSTSWEPSLSEFSFCLSLLPYSEQCDVGRFIKFEDKKRALISRLMQHMLIHSLLNIPYSDVVLCRTEEGKPYLANYLEKPNFPNLNFNVSHHGDYVAIASEPLCVVGLDIMVHDVERQETIQQYINIFRPYFTKLEWENINSVGPTSQPLLDQFNRHWCMKEAYIKALGVGLSFELQRVEFYYPEGDVWSDIAYLRLDGQEKDDWSFCLHQLENNHWACVARGPPSAAVESFRKTLHRVDFDDATITCALQMTNKPFSVLTIEDIIPASKMQEFKIHKNS